MTSCLRVLCFFPRDGQRETAAFLICTGSPSASFERRQEHGIVSNCSSSGRWYLQEALLLKIQQENFETKSGLFAVRLVTSLKVSFIEKKKKNATRFPVLLHGQQNLACWETGTLQVSLLFTVHAVRF